MLYSCSWASYGHFSSFSQPQIENEKKQKLHNSRGLSSVYCRWVDGESRMQEITLMTTALQPGVITHRSVTLCRSLTAARCRGNFCSCFHSARRQMQPRSRTYVFLQVKTLIEEPTGRITLSRDKISHTKGELSLSAK